MEIVIHFFIIILIGVFPITICLGDLTQMFSQFKSKEYFFFCFCFLLAKTTTCLRCTNLFTFCYSLLSSFKPKANHFNHHPVITVGYTMWMSTAVLFRPEFRGTPTAMVATMLNFVSSSEVSTIVLVEAQLTIAVHFSQRFSISLIAVSRWTPKKYTPRISFAALMFCGKRTEAISDEINWISSSSEA